MKIYRRYIAPECQRPVHLDTEIKRRIVESICTEQGHVAADCFDEAQKVVVEMLETEYFPDFLTSQFHAKHQVDVLTSGQVLLADILYNDTALFHFMEFLEGHGQRVVMEFWLAAMNFSQANSRGATECQNDAMVLYDKFLSMQVSIVSTSASKANQLKMTSNVSGSIPIRTPVKCSSSSRGCYLQVS